jgi:hypothetical protein
MMSYVFIHEVYESKFYLNYILYLNLECKLFMPVTYDFQI